MAALCGQSRIGLDMNLKAKLCVAALMSAMADGVPAIPYAPPSFTFMTSETHALIEDGTVESVRAGPLRPKLGGFESALEHAINPEVADEVVVRLDNGGTITFLHEGLPRFTAGQRVGVHPGAAVFPSY
jgi:hypothetical protein